MWRGTFVLLALLHPLTFTNVHGEDNRIRHRRSWIMPGTMWCGAGSTAENFTNLGVFSGLDICCREHDHCFAQIQSFEFLYGIRNYRLHTVSHCDCDQRFRQCLHDVNDTMSTLVGIMYFNILEMPCFTLTEKEQCVEWYWWGGCKRNGTSPKAELQTPSVFNYSKTEDKNTTTPSPYSVRHSSGSTLHKSTPKAFSLSSSSMNTVKNKRRRLKKLERAETNEIVKGSGGITVSRRGDSEEAEQKRSFSHQSDKHSFQKRRQRSQERHKKTANAQNSTITG